jgi:hypothetical protein
MRISKLKTADEQDARRVSADVDGEPLWFESKDLQLSPAPEAYASAMLIPALDRGEALMIDDALNETWLSNVRQLLPIFQEWWGFPEFEPQPDRVRSDEEAGPGEEARTGRTALCFSGGVDSFYTLLRSGRQIHQLIFVIGFDMKLNDHRRCEAFERTLREVATASGAAPVVIRTNLREHPAFARVSWEFTHGAALAAVGHLLGDRTDQFLVSASQTNEQTDPWGSHWLTDRYWSSDKLRVVTVGSELHRYEKVWEIAGEPLAQSNLRVCWENRAPAGNCSRCEKCVRTRLLLAECGELDNFSVFMSADSIVEDLDALPHCRNIKLAYRALLASGRIDQETKAAISRLIGRTERFNRALRRIERRRERLRQANQWLERKTLWRKLPWRFRAWIHAMMGA